MSNWRMTAILGVGLSLGCYISEKDGNLATAEELINGSVEFWATKDLNQLDSVYADDAVLEDVPEGTSYQGLEQIKACLKDDITYAPDVKVEVVSLTATGDRGVSEWVWSGTQTGDIPGLMPATGRPFSVRGVSVFEFEDGKIKAQKDYYDAAGFLLQLGVEIKMPEFPQQQ